MLQGDGHPICPVMLHDSRLALEFADEMLKKGIYVIGFTYPVVTKGKTEEAVTLGSHGEVTAFIMSPWNEDTPLIKTL